MGLDEPGPGRGMLAQGKVLNASRARAQRFHCEGGPGEWRQAHALWAVQLAVPCRQCEDPAGLVPGPRSFPELAHDDEVDACSGALEMLNQQLKNAGYYEWLRLKAEEYRKPQGANSIAAQDRFSPWLRGMGSRTGGEEKGPNEAAAVK